MHDVKEGNRDKAIGKAVGVFRSSEANRHCASAYHGQLGVKDIVGPAVGQCETDRPEGLASKVFSNIFRSHRRAPSMLAPLPSVFSTLNRTGSPQCDVEVAHGGNDHGQKSEAIDADD